MERSSLIRRLLRAFICLLLCSAVQAQQDLSGRRLYVQFTANYFLLYDYQPHCVVVVVFRVDRAALLKWGLNACVVQFTNQLKAAISV